MSATDSPSMVDTINAMDGGDDDGGPVEATINGPPIYPIFNRTLLDLRKYYQTV